VRKLAGGSVRPGSGCGWGAARRATMPSAKVRAAPMSRAQSDIANRVCKRDFDHEQGPKQWSARKKLALVKEINREFVSRSMEPIYNVDKLDMWTGNSLYRWRVKRRNARPKSWAKKSRGGRQALVGKDDNQPAEPRTPIACQAEAALPERAAMPAACPVQSPVRADSGTQTPEPMTVAQANNPIVSELCAQATEPGVETPVPPVLVHPSLPVRRAHVPLERLSSAASGDDWWLPYRPGRACAVTTELNVLVAADSSSCLQLAPSGNRDPAHVPASPAPVCRVTRPLSTLLALRAAPGGCFANARDAVGRLR
jgi:hypothetical protein